MSKTKKDKIDHFEIRIRAIETALASLLQDFEKFKRESDVPAPPRQTKKKERVQKIADFYTKKGIV